MSVNKKKNSVKYLSITKLMNAVKNNRIEDVRKSLNSYGLPKNGSKTTDYFILQTAINKRRISIAKLLINAGSRVNSISNDGCTPLALAVINENKELTSLLLENGAKLNVVNDCETTVLHIAAKIRSLRMLKYLLRYEINNVNDISNGKTPFQVFLENCYNYNINEKKNIAIIRLFMEKGASISFKTSDGQTVLHHITKIKQKDIIKTILQATDNVNEQDKSKNTVLHNLLKYYKPEEEIIEIVKILISKGAKVNIQDNLGDTACHLAAKNKYLQVLQIFIQYEWDVNCCNQDNNTVLHLILKDSALSFNDKLQFTIVDYILKQNSCNLLPNNQGETPLYIAAVNKQTQVLNDLLSLSVDISISYNNCTTILYIFIENLLTKATVPDKTDIEIVKKMILKGASPSFYHRYNKNTPLQLALLLQNKEILLLMLECKCIFDNFHVTPNRLILPYLCCSKVNFTETEDIDMAAIAEIFIKKGATVDSKDSHSRTPLYWAVLMRRKHMVKTLLEYGADPNLCDNQGDSILTNLMKNEVIDFPINKIEYRIITRMNIETRSVCIGEMTKTIKIPQNIERESEIAQMLFLKEVDAENVPNSQLSIFYYCAINSHLDMLLKIIPYCKNVNICDDRGYTILHTLLSCNLNVNEEVETKVAEIVLILLLKGADIRALNNQNETSLHLAAKSKHLKTSQILLEEHKNVTDLDKNGNTVLHFVCMQQFQTNNSVEDHLIDLFLSKGCNINARNDNGMTPLQVAVEFGTANICGILIRRGAKVDCTKHIDLAMPIHCAAKLNRKDVIEQLIQHGVDVNVKQKDGKTALHISVTHELPVITRLLLKNGADTDLKDNNGKTSLHWACWYESLENMNELLEYGADVNAEDNFQVTPLMLTQYSYYVWIKLLYHVAILQIADMPVSTRNKNYIIKFNEEYRYLLNMSYFMERLENEAIEETVRMKNIIVNNHTTLIDLLQMSVYKMSFLRNNEDFRKLVYSNDFEEKFPIYVNLVRACYRKVIVRSDLLLPATDAFRTILGLRLPDLCCETIFSYLDNDNLHNLNKAAMIRISKRKTFFDEINADRLSKRIRRNQRIIRTRRSKKS